MTKTKEYKEKHYNVARKQQLDHLIEIIDRKDEYQFNIDIKKATYIIVAASLILTLF